VYELARELNISSKDILRLLAEKMHIDMNNHMATLNDQVVARLRQLVAEERGQAGAAQQKARTAPAAPRPAPPATSGPAPAAARPPASARPMTRAAQTPPPAAARQATVQGARTGPVHVRPAPGLLPLVTPRPSPVRPRRAPAPRPEPALPSAPVPTAGGVASPASPPPTEPVAPPEPMPATPPAAQIPAAAAAVPPAAETEGPAPVPPAPRAPERVAAEASPAAGRPPAAELPDVAMEPTRGTTAPEAAPPEAPRGVPARPAVARPAAAAVTARARPEGGAATATPSRPLLPVRRIQPGEAPPLRYPDRALLPVRKVDPTAPRPAPAAAAIGAPVPAPAHPGAPRRGRRPGERERTGLVEGGPGTLEVRRRGGAGRRPSRPGAVTFAEGEESGRRLRRRRGRRFTVSAEPEAPVRPERITLSGPVLVSELAAMLAVGAPEVIRKLLDHGVMAAIHQQVEVDQARQVAEDFGVAVDVEHAAAPGEAEASAVDRQALSQLLAADDPGRGVPRPPIVTVLGHVDHGKTTLLDAIRKTRVAAGEAGGITQHIGAYTVRRGDRTVVFLDTPGHEAFTAMRARGAQVTDIAVLVVAADDGMMPQTREALAHARAAGVPVVVALNKIDKPEANPDRVMQQLAEAGLVPEAWGGDTIVVPVSALKGQGIDELLEMLLLVADMQELRADPDRAAVGTVIEAKVTRGRGPVATVLVQTGTLHVGETFVAGTVFGRVRALIDDLGRNVREAGPSTPVEVLGFDEVPAAGDVFQVLPEREARELAAQRQEGNRREALLAVERAVSLEEFHQARTEGAPEDLSVIVKADVQGSLEAVRGALEKLHNEELRVVVLHAGVGPVNESDVMLAAASRAVVLGFNVRPDPAAEREAQRTGVEIKTYRIIYELLDEVQRALDGRLKPKYETVTIGHAEVRRPIRVPDVGVVAGSAVTDGVVRRGARVRVVRQGTIVHEGSIASLRRFKDDVREVAAGFECGIGLERWNDVKEGDVIEVLEEREVPR
jgi:translation initiation factor IF-2